MTQGFTQRGARSPMLVWGLGLALVVESVAVHALLGRRWPVVDLVLVVFNIATVWWLVRHQRAVGDRPVEVGEAGILVQHGTMVRVMVPWAQVARVTRPEWKDQPTDVTPGFLKLSGGDDPNVLVQVEPPVAVALALGLTRQVRVLGLRLDDAPGFVSAVERVGPRRETQEPMDGAGM